MSFLTPLAFLGALFAIPIILLYMLRLRRREVMISSTYLWQQVLQDYEANTPWQKLKRNLLLFLQLIILALLVLALARPFMTVPAVSAGQVTVLLDASASMNATDVEADSRFEAAKQEALSIVETLSSGDKMTVIRVADVPEVLVSSTSDRSRLRSAIRGAQPGLAEGDWEAALNLAAAGSATTDDFTIVMISDGGLPQGAGLPGVSGTVRYIPVGTSGENVAITALATRALPGQNPQLFSQVTNYSDQEARVVFTLLVDGERFATSNEVIPAGSSLPIVSSALPEGFSTLEATLTQSVNSVADDYLAVDDTAFAVASNVTSRRVLLVTNGNIFIEQVLRSLPGIETVRTNGQNGLPENYDVYIFDNLIPDTLPDGDLFFLNPPESTQFFTLGAETLETANPTVNVTDARMTFVDVRQLHVLRFRPLGGAEWAEPLISVEGGAVLLAGEVENRQIVVLPFDLRESDLPLQITFPILMANLMEWFTPQSAIAINNSLTAGESLIVRPPFDAETVRVTLPDGSVQNYPVERETVIFADTNTSGIYTLDILAGDKTLTTQPFAVNLFSPLESRIEPVAENALRLQGTIISLDDTEELGQREFWPLIAALALVFLMVEWYAYHQRLRVPTVFRPLPRRQTAG